MQSNTARIYIRVSSIKQCNGYSLDHQRLECIRWVRNNQPDYIIQVYCEVRSGRSSLPILHRLISDIQPNDIVVFYSIDRLSRNIRDGLDIIDSISEKGATWYIVRENISSVEYSNNNEIRNRFHIELVRSQYESDMISERVRRIIGFTKRNRKTRSGKPSVSKVK